MTDPRKANLSKDEAIEKLYDAGVHAYLAALGGDDVSERVGDALYRYLEAVLSDPGVLVAALGGITIVLPPREIDGEGE